ncbi:MAG: filamentous hemagglutinin N-terminal domain-containing protein [Nitrospira sp.]|nr:filamentous hemagglutinin N-terminal domain-containing protein [Nitrospira sp.]
MGKRRGVVQSMCWFRAMALVGVLTLLWVPVSLGQTTSITSSGLNTQISHVAGQPNYDITGGTRPGNGTNLFHSFGDFSVGTNHIANFLNDSGLPTSNILGRVTGGNPSNIFGTIQTTGFGNANLFFMNPAGIVFGPNASLNVGGSVTFTTADYIKLADGVRFKALANTTSDTLLSAVPVAAFGFLGSTPGAITVLGSQLSVAEGKGISLVGGNTQITGGTTITAPGGQINLASLVGRGEARIASDGIAIAGKISRGHIAITGGSQPDDVARIDTSGDGGGAVVIRGGKLSLTRAEVLTGAKADNQRGGDIVIEAGKSVTLDKGSLTTEVIHHAQNAQSGNMSLHAGESIQILNGSRLSADTANYVQNPDDIVRQDAGNIVIQAGKSVVSRNSTISAKAQAETGNGGTILIEAGQRVVSEASTLSVAGVSPAGGDSGQILVRAGDSVWLRNGTILDGTNSGPGGDAAHIVLDAGRHVIVDASSVITPVEEGGAGRIEMHAGKDVRLVNGTVVNASASARVLGSQIVIDAGRNILVDRSQLRVPVGDGGAAHKIEMHAGNGVWLTRETVLDATGGASGGGQIVIAGDSVVVDGSRLTVDVRSGIFGGPGKVTVMADGSVRFVNGTLVTASAPGLNSGGQVSVTAGDSVLLRNSTIQTSANFGDGGSIGITSEMVRLKNGRLISTADEGTGGMITIKTNDFRSDAASVVDVRGSVADGTVTIAPLP